MLRLYKLTYVWATLLLIKIHVGYFSQILKPIIEFAKQSKTSSYSPSDKDWYGLKSRQSQRKASSRVYFCLGLDKALAFYSRAVIMQPTSVAQLEHGK